MHFFIQRSSEKLRRANVYCLYGRYFTTDGSAGLFSVTGLIITRMETEKMHTRFDRNYEFLFEQYIYTRYSRDSSSSEIQLDLDLLIAARNISRIYIYIYRFHETQLGSWWRETASKFPSFSRLLRPECFYICILADLFRRPRVL